MEVTFDPAKSAWNVEHRGIAFGLAEHFDCSPAVVTAYTREDYGEDRFQALGPIDGVLHMLVFTRKQARLMSLASAVQISAKGTGMNPRPNPELLDDDASEADDDWFARAKPAAELLPDLFGPDVAAEMLSKRPRRPDSARDQEEITIALDVDVVGAFRATGPGWQSRLNRALRDWLRERTPAS